MTANTLLTHKVNISQNGSIIKPAPINDTATTKTGVAAQWMAQANDKNILMLPSWVDLLLFTFQTFDVDETV